MSMMGNRWHLRRSPFVRSSSLSIWGHSLARSSSSTGSNHQYPPQGRLQIRFFSPQILPPPQEFRIQGFSNSLLWNSKKSQNQKIQFNYSIWIVKLCPIKWNNVMENDYWLTVYIISYLCQSYTSYQYVLNSYPKHYWNDWRTRDYSKCLFQDEFVAAGFFNIRRRIWSCLTIWEEGGKRVIYFGKSEFPL